MISSFYVSLNTLMYIMYVYVHACVVCIGLIIMDEIDFPVAGKQVPDVFIYLSLEGNALPYCFARIKSADLLAAKFKSPPQWVVFQEEKNINGLDTGVYPGHLHSYIHMFLLKHATHSVVFPVILQYLCMFIYSNINLYIIISICLCTYFQASY